MYSHMRRRASDLAHDHFAYGSTLMERWMAQHRERTRNFMQEAGPLLLFSATTLAWVLTQPPPFQQYPFACLVGFMVALASLFASTTFVPLSARGVRFTHPALALVPHTAVVLLPGALPPRAYTALYVTAVTAYAVAVVTVVLVARRDRTARTRRKKGMLEHLNRGEPIDGRGRTSSFGHLTPIGASPKLRAAPWNLAVTDEDWDPLEH